MSGLLSIEQKLHLIDLFSNIWHKDDDPRTLHRKGDSDSFYDEASSLLRIPKSIHRQSLRSRKISGLQSVIRKNKEFYLDLLDYISEHDSPVHNLFMLMHIFGYGVFLPSVIEGMTHQGTEDLVNKFGYESRNLGWIYEDAGYATRNAISWTNRYSKGMALDILFESQYFYN